MNGLSKQPVYQIVEAIADEENVEPVTLEPPLADVIDPDALETLIEDTTASDLELCFTYRDYEVAIDENGHVQIN